MTQIILLKMFYIVCLDIVKMPLISLDLALFDFFFLGPMKSQVYRGFNESIEEDALWVFENLQLYK